MTPTPEIDTSTPHSARVYDYWLNGKNNYEADAEAARRVSEIWPTVRVGAQLNRAFMHRATRWLAAEAGIRQFLDVGTGIPTEPNLHQIAQSVAPEARVLYADNDPIVLQYAQALLHSTPEGRTAYLHADVTRPRDILESSELRETLDLGRPVALSLMALLHLISDERGAYEIVRTLVDALPSGSYVMLTHATDDLDPELMARVATFYESSVTGGGQLRSKEGVLRFFDGLELVEPGLVVAHRWRPELNLTDDVHKPRAAAEHGEADEPEEAVVPEREVSDAELSVYGGVARKP
ncbi:SAM-dependent methyltransferase [Streptomyces sp. NPDC054796]